MNRDLHYIYLKLLKHEWRIRSWNNDWTEMIIEWSKDIYVTFTTNTGAGP